jgi:pimeloyl-ACP methyl ester carboxylesterase
MEWASVVEEVLDHLRIDRCSIMAHSAGAPYAMAFASRNAGRVQGDLCLLAPWVGAGEGGTLFVPKIIRVVLTSRYIRSFWLQMVEICTYRHH